MLARSFGLPASLPDFRGDYIACFRKQVEYYPGFAGAQLLEYLLYLDLKREAGIGEFGPLPGDELFRQGVQGVRLDPVQGNLDPILATSRLLTLDDGIVWFHYDFN